MSRTAAPKPMACLTIGFQRVLLPANRIDMPVSARQGAARPLRIAP